MVSGQQNFFFEPVLREPSREQLESTGTKKQL